MRNFLMATLCLLIATSPAKSAQAACGYSLTTVTPISYNPDGSVSIAEFKVNDGTTDHLVTVWNRSLDLYRARLGITVGDDEQTQWLVANTDLPADLHLMGEKLVGGDIDEVYNGHAGASGSATWITQDTTLVAGMELEAVVIFAYALDYFIGSSESQTIAADIESDINTSGTCY